MVRLCFQTSHSSASCQPDERGGLLRKAVLTDVPQYPNQPALRAPTLPLGPLDLLPNAKQEAHSAASSNTDDRLLVADPGPQPTVRAVQDDSHARRFADLLERRLRSRERMDGRRPPSGWESEEGDTLTCSVGCSARVGRSGEGREGKRRRADGERMRLERPDGRRQDSDVHVLGREEAGV